MLELTYCKPEFFSCERLEPPCLLRFTGQTGKLSFLHTVAWMDTPYRIMAIQRMKGEAIWISDRSNGYGIELPRHHILAVRQGGRHPSLFGSQEPEKYNARRIRVWQERRSPQKRKPPRPSRSKKVQRQTSAT